MSIRAPIAPPDPLCDPEKFPWPWADGTVDEILTTPALEHFGATTEVYFSVLRETYRICRPDARITNGGAAGGEGSAAGVTSAV